MNRLDIEKAARAVQYEVWKDREILWPMGAPPVHAMFDPQVVAHKLGWEIEYRETIPALPGSKSGTEAAGTFDRRRGVIAISTSFDYRVQRFTAAHEIGHGVLHPKVGSGPLHRDRPIFEMAVSRPAIEQEADYFAACLLVPFKLLHEAFEARFGTKKPLPCTEAVAFHLGASASGIFNAPRPARAFGLALATATRFNRRQFPALTAHFGVSAAALAIRLEEAGLIID